MLGLFIYYLHKTLCLVWFILLTIQNLHWPFVYHKFCENILAFILGASLTAYVHAPLTSEPWKWQHIINRNIHKALVDKNVNWSTDHSQSSGHGLPFRTWLALPAIGLTLKWQETHLCANCLGQLWYKRRLGAWKATSLFLNQSWLRIECTMMKNFQSNIFQNSNAFIKT